MTANLREMKKYVSLLVKMDCFNIVAILSVNSCKSNIKEDVSTSIVQEVEVVDADDQVTNVEKNSFLNRQRASGKYWLDIPVA